MESIARVSSSLSLIFLDPPEHYPSPRIRADPSLHLCRRYLARVLRSLDFFLDLGADATFPRELIAKYSYRRTPVVQSQYIHRSGAAIVSILSGPDDLGPGFAYVPNRIFTSHHPAVDEDEPRRRLEALCRDGKRLRQIWDEVDQHEGD